MANLCEILYQGNFPVHYLDFVEVAPPPRLESLIPTVEDRWQQFLKRKPHAQPNPVISIRKVEPLSTKLIVYYARTDYKWLIGTSYPELLDLHPEAVHSGAGISAVIRTLDNKIVLQRRTGRTLYNNCWEVIGGKLEEPDPEEILLSEIEEELGIPRAYCEPAVFLGIAYEKTPGLFTHNLCCSLKIRLEFHEITKRHAILQSVEGQLFPINDEQPDVLSALAEEKQWVPARHANLYLYASARGWVTMP